MNSWFPEGLESFILPGDSDKTFVWWHRNESLCWTTVGIMRGVMSTPKTCGTFPVGPGGRWRRRCEARVGPDNAKETNAVTVSGPASLPFFVLHLFLVFLPASDIQIFTSTNKLACFDETVATDSFMYL